MNSLTNEENNIIKELEKRLIPLNLPVITQERFDAIVEELIIKDYREIMFRLCGAYPKYNYNKVIDYFIENKDSWYVEELVSFVNGELDLNYLVNKMIETNDKLFVKESLELCGCCMESYLDDLLLKKLYLFLESYNDIM